MGIVYQAVDPVIGRTIAIKTFHLLPSDAPEQQSFLKDRFFREARAAGTLSHPNIVTIYQILEQGDAAYIAMEFVSGPSLDKLRQADYAFSKQKVLEIIAQTASALDYAHSKGIIHRDIKPANILIAEDGTVKVCDFGVARIVGEQGVKTQTGWAVGSPSYMSPEQIEGKAVDGRTDQFALGVIAYELLTRRRPFQGETLTALFYQILHERPAPVSLSNPTLGDQVEGVLAKALDKQPAQRYSTCTGFANALGAALNLSDEWHIALESGSAENSGIAAPGLAVVGTRSVLTPVGRYSQTEPESPARRSRAAWLAGAVFLVVGLLAGTAYYRLRPDHSSGGNNKPPLNNQVPPSQPDKNPPSQAPPPATGGSQRSDQSGGQITAGSSGARPVRDVHPATSDEKPNVSSVPSDSLPLTASPVPVRTPALSPQWAVFRGNFQHNGVTAVLGPAHEPRIVWRAELGGQLRTSPVIGFDGTVFAGTIDGTLFAVRDGRVLWNHRVETAGAFLLSLDATGNLHVKDISGNVFQVSSAGQRLNSGRSILLPYDYAQSPDLGIYYITGSTLLEAGHSSWNFDLGDLPSTPVVLDGAGNLYVGTAKGILHCVSRLGKSRWSYRAPVKITAAPAVRENGDVIFGCFDGYLYCVRGGELRWRFLTRGPVFSAPAIDPSGIAYFGSADGYFYAISDAGELVWKVNLQNEIHAAPAMDRHGRLYVASIQRFLYCLSDK
jgi:serine/threonine-protein kinase